ncbi:MAG TPA: HEAT repeat domain-containing protein [Ktedonobacteraceae bacterium]|nr:HEAT repeat domain-containing protein [Ktedonobacteraceae bacterium]
MGKHHLDEGWMAEQAPAYITAVTLLELEDYPPQSGEDEIQPGAVYCLIVSHPDWIAHLNQGALWETTAYQIPPSRQVTSSGKPWKALFADLMKHWERKKRKKFRVNDEVLRHLIDALDCEDEAIAIEATYWLERIEKANAAVPRLLWALDDRNYRVRNASLYTLGAIKDSRAVSSFLCHLRCCDKEERWGLIENIAALLALLHLRPQVTLALKTVERCAASPNMQQCLTSLLALYQITGEEAYLERFLSCYQQHQGGWDYFGEVVCDFSSRALLKLLPALLEELEHGE